MGDHLEGNRRIRVRALQDRLDVIALYVSAIHDMMLTSSKMRVDGHVSGCSAQTLSLSVGDMLFAEVRQIPSITHVLGSLYCLAIPKSTTWMVFAPFVAGRPIKKLSGLISR